MFPNYLFAVGGGGKRVALGMFGYDYDGEHLDSSHFEWLVSKLIRSNRNYTVYIIDTETANKEKDFNIANNLTKKVEDLKRNLSREGYKGSLKFISINLEPTHGYSYECIAGVQSIKTIKRFILDNYGGKYYWLNAKIDDKSEDYDYGDVDPEIYKKVMSVLGNDILSIQNGVNRNRAITKALWVNYLINNKELHILPDITNANIAIVGGLGGGTGSSLIIELARKYYGKNRIFIFGFLPACEGESSLSYACGYISLTELERWIINDSNFRNSVHVLLIPLNFVNPQAGIAYTGETQDIELRKFPKSLLFTILTLFKKGHGAGQEPLSVPDSNKMVRPFILASTYLIKVFGSKQIEQEFREYLLQVKNILNEISNKLKIFDDDIRDPSIDSYIKLIERLKDEFDLLKMVIDLYERVGISPKIKKVIDDLYNEINNLERTFEKVENIIAKYNLRKESERRELEEYLRSKNLNYFAVVKAPFENIYRQLEDIKLSGSEIDDLFLEIIRDWIGNIYNLVRKADNILNWLKEELDLESYAIFFLSSCREELEETISGLLRKRNNIDSKLKEVDEQLNGIENAKKYLEDKINADNELKEYLEELKETSKDKKLFSNRDIINKFEGYLDEFILEVLNLEKKELEQHVDDNFRRLVPEIERRIKENNPDISDTLEKFREILRVAQKYDFNIVENKLNDQLRKIIGYRYHSLKCGKFRGKDHCKERNKIKDELDRTYLSFIRIVDENNYQIIITVDGRPFVDYILNRIEEKEGELKNNIRDILMNKLLDLYAGWVESEIDLSVISYNILDCIESIFDSKINELNSLKEKYKETIKKIDEIHRHITDLLRNIDLIYLSKNKIEDMLNSLTVETCNAYELAKVEYTFGIAKHGDFDYLLVKDENIKNNVEEYILSQIDCFIQRSNLFLGYKRIPISGKGCSVSFDKVFVLIGIPEGVERIEKSLTTSTHELINTNKINELISRWFYPGGRNTINYSTNNINVNPYKITTQDYITITFVLVGVSLDNLSLIDKYYDCFKNGGRDVGYSQVGEAIYIRFVYNLENGTFYVRELIQENKLGEVYVDNDYRNILKKIEKAYKEKSYVRGDNHAQK